MIPTNCICQWTRTPTTPWSRIKHVVGCPVHGADNQPANHHDGKDLKAALTFSFETGLTVLDMIWLAEQLLKADARLQSHVLVRVGWANHVRRIDVRSDM